MWRINLLCLYLLDRDRLAGMKYLTCQPVPIKGGGIKTAQHGARDPTKIRGSQSRGKSQSTSRRMERSPFFVIVKRTSAFRRRENQEVTMRHKFKIASAITLTILLVGLAIPIASAQSSDFCANKAAMIFGQAQPLPAQSPCGTGVYVLVDPWSDTVAKGPTTRHTEWQSLLAAAAPYKGGSVWFEPASRGHVGQIWEPSGPGTFVAGTGALAFEGITSLDQLQPYRPSNPGTLSAVQYWHTPGGPYNPQVRIDGLSWDQALGMLLISPGYYNSGSIWFVPQTFDAIPVPVSVTTQIIIVVTATPLPLVDTPVPPADTPVPSVPTPTPPAPPVPPPTGGGFPSTWWHWALLGLGAIVFLGGAVAVGKFVL